MSLKYKIFDDKALVVNKLSGDLGLDTVNSFFSRIIKDERFSTVTLAITDITKAHFSINLSEVDDFVDFVRHSGVPDQFRWAILSTRPLPTAIAYLVSIAPLFRNRVAIFSTLEGCCTYLGTELTEQEFNDGSYLDFNPLKLMREE